MSAVAATARTAPPVLPFMRSASIEQKAVPQGQGTGNGMTEMQAVGPKSDGDILLRVKARLQAQLGKDIYASWFERMKIDEMGKGVVRLSVPTAFLKTWINSHYSDMLLAIFAEEVPGTLKVDISVRTAVRSQQAANQAEAVAARRRPPNDEDLGQKVNEMGGIDGGSGGRSEGRNARTPIVCQQFCI